MASILWIESGYEELIPVRDATALHIYDRPMGEIPNGPAGDPERIVPIRDLIEAYEQVHGLDIITGKKKD